MDTEQQAIENTQQQLPANNSGTAQEISPKSRLIAFLLAPSQVMWEHTTSMLVASVVA